jgi:hypothetical protein
MESILPLSGPRRLLPAFRNILAERGAAAARSPETRVAQGGIYELFYTPFEVVNRTARLVLVGITPGSTQIELSYAEAQRLIGAGASDEVVLQGAKAHAAFGGPSMRPNLLRMLHHFRFRELLGIDDPSELWDSSSHLLHATSVVPYAAFRAGKMFAGSFEDVLSSSVLSESFELDFAASLPLLPPDALFVALGPTPLAALDHCAKRGLLRPQQVLGAFAHPSAGGGSQVAIYLGEKRPEELAPGDPVRGRLGFLLSAAERMRVAVAAQLGERGVNAPTCRVPDIIASAPADRSLKALAKAPPAIASVPQPATGLHYVVTRGAKAGAVLRPHVHGDGCIVISPTRFEKDYVRLRADADVEPWLARGYSLRMSAPGCAPSLIAPASIRGRDMSVS